MSRLPLKIYWVPQIFLKKKKGICPLKTIYQKKKKKAKKMISNPITGLKILSLGI